MESEVVVDESMVRDSEPSDPEGLEVLNTALSWELTSMMAYSHRVLAVAGNPERATIRRLFDYSCQDRRSASRLSARLLQLGGQPNHDPREIYQRSARFRELGLAAVLRQSLRDETRAARAYLTLCERIPVSDPVSYDLFTAVQRTKRCRVRELLGALATARD